MQNYDAVFKQLLQGQARSVLEVLSGKMVERWLPTELPRVEIPRMDLLGETADGELIHIELQSTNDPQMGLRMAEYLLRTYRVHGRFPKQTVLYVGEAPMSMPNGLKGPFSFEYGLVDIRELDGDQLADSPWLADNIIAFLGRCRDRREVLRRVLERISKMSGEARGVAFQQVSILAGLRQLGKYVEEEVKHMPILSDMMEHDLFGPVLREGIEQGLKQGSQQGIEQGMKQGMEQGRQQGMEQGRQQGMEQLVRRQIEKRFGPIPSTFESQLAQLSPADLDRLALRVLDAQSIEELFHGE